MVGEGVNVLYRCAASTQYSGGNADYYGTDVVSDLHAVLLRWMLGKGLPTTRSDHGKYIGPECRTLDVFPHRRW